MYTYMIAIETFVTSIMGMERLPCFPKISNCVFWKFLKSEFRIVTLTTPPRTPRISRLKSQILKPTYLSNIMAKSGLVLFILKFY